jgi:hypothetical protein
MGVSFGAQALHRAGNRRGEALREITAPVRFA